MRNLTTRALTESEQCLQCNQGYYNNLTSCIPKYENTSGYTLNKTFFVSGNVPILASDSQGFKDYYTNLNKDTDGFGEYFNSSSPLLLLIFT